MPRQRRRVHAADLRTGELRLEPAQARHLRDVLRIETGQTIELFDDDGRSAEGIVTICDAEGVVVQISEICAKPPPARRLVMASAVPKGERADWLVEKLSELGVDEFVPLMTRRSVVHPEGSAKLDRWKRIATESAQQSRRSGVMAIARLSELPALLERWTDGAIWCLSTDSTALPIQQAVADLHSIHHLAVLIGPEGGWTADELEAFTARGVTSIHLTDTILRIETAAITAAGVIRSLWHE